MRRAFLIAALLACPARADFRVHWLAPDNCADHPHAAELAPGAEGRAEVQLREESGRWLVTVLFFEPEQGLRRVTTSTCAEAVRTASLLLKLGSDGALPLDAPPSPPAVAAPPPPAQPTTPAEAPWYFSLGAGPAFDVGAFATVETRIAISASATRELLRFALDARVGLPRSVATDLTAMRVVELQGAGCLNLSWRSLAGGPCLAMSAGSWSVDARWGKSRTVMTAAVGAQLRLSAILVPGLGLELSAVGGVRFNVARPVVIVADSKVFAMALIGADLQLALGWRW